MHRSYAVHSSFARFAIAKGAWSLSALAPRELASFFREFPHKGFQLTTTAVSGGGKESGVAAASPWEWR